jgi:hypothetical protein
MARRCLLLIALTALSACGTAGAIGEAGGRGLHVPDWAPGPNPQAPVTAEHEGTIGRASEAVNAAVGIPQQIRERLMAQVGGQLGLENRAEPLQARSTVGLDMAALRTEHANTMGHRPDSVPGLDNVARFQISEQAKAALGGIPSQWIRAHLLNDEAPTATE